jgi:hypothetical protein
MIGEVGLALDVPNGHAGNFAFWDGPRWGGVVRGIAAC